jgi:hypothetical protein
VDCCFLVLRRGGVVVVVGVGWIGIRMVGDRG